MKKNIKFLIFLWFLVFGFGFWSSDVWATTKAIKKSKPYVVHESSWIFGTSWQGQPLWAYSFGKGKNITLYLAGVHSGVERGAVGLANSWLSHLQKNKNIVPKKHKVIIIPNLNPDGWINYTRTNAHGVDLNRNFSVGWQMWANLWFSKIYAGPKPFSEHESIALRDLIQKEKIKKLIDFHMNTNQVFAAYFNDKLHTKSLKFAKFYNAYAGYPENYSFNYYKVTGDIISWTAKNLKAKAITVELGADGEFEKNKKAMEMAIKY
jgi:predicted deacylase